MPLGDVASRLRRQLGSEATLADHRIGCKGAAVVGYAPEVDVWKVARSDPDGLTGIEPGLEDQVTPRNVAVEIPSDVFEVARRTAARDNVDVTTLLSDLVMRRAEYIDALSGDETGMPAFSLEDYEMQRDPGESDEDYENRLSLFRDLI